MTEKNDITKLTKQIIASPPGGVYFLYGKEEFLKRHFLTDLKNAVIPADVADLNYSAVSGADGKAADKVLELAYTLPQFSDSRMIVWYNSEYPVCQARYKKKTEEVISAVSNFPYLHLVIYATDDEFEGTSKEEKAALSKINGTVLFFDYLSPARLQKWVIRHFEADRISVSDKIVFELCSRCSGMNELSAAIDKICAYVRESGRSAAELSDIDALIPKKIEFSAFFISDNIRKRDPAALVAYIGEAKASSQKPQAILSAIISEAEKLCRIKFAQKAGVPAAQTAKVLGLNEYVVKLSYPSVQSITEEKCTAFLHACYEADKKLKSTSADAWGVLMQLVCSI